MVLSLVLYIVHDFKHRTEWRMQGDQEEEVMAMDIIILLHRFELVIGKLIIETRYAA